MQSQDSISENTNTGLARREDLLAERGRKMYLQRAAGLSNQDIAIRFGVDPADVDGLIRVAEDNFVLSEIEEEVRVANLQETYDIDLKLMALYNETPTVTKRKSQGIGNVKVGDRSRPVIMNLEEDYFHVVAKKDILKERRQLVGERHRLLGARKPGGGDGEDKAAMSQILETIKDVTREVMSEAGVMVGDAHERAIEEAREVGRLQARTDGSGLMIPGSAVIEVEAEGEENPEGGSDEQQF